MSNKNRDHETVFSIRVYGEEATLLDQILTRYGEEGITKSDFLRSAINKYSGEAIFDVKEPVKPSVATRGLQLTVWMSRRDLARLDRLWMEAYDCRNRADYVRKAINHYVEQEVFKDHNQGIILDTPLDEDTAYGCELDLLRVGYSPLRIRAEHVDNKGLSEETPVIIEQRQSSESATGYEYVILTRKASDPTECEAIHYLKPTYKTNRSIEEVIKND